MRLPLLSRWMPKLHKADSPAFAFPSALEAPSAIAVVVGTEPGDIWAGLLLMNNLIRHYACAEITAVVPEEELDLLNLLPRLPLASPYGRDRIAVGERWKGCAGDGSVAFCVSSGRAASGLLQRTGARVRVSAVRTASANLEVRLSPRPVPETVHGMCEALGISPDRSWKPVSLPDDSARASEILAPVSGRSLPYIAADGGMLRVMRRFGAEIPLRVVQVSGRESAVASEGRAVRAAVTAGASAVLADTRGLWAEAGAFGVPVVGLDRRGSFPDWGREPARSASDLSAQWTTLLRQGW
ncbi:hypothetical protein GX411_02085 [Candidatus Fermentibacteria bacterium]|nr:hypothetical protein [Candidatus Fermentibacteria bacterium]